MVSRPRLAMSALVGLLAAASFGAAAQQVYRIIGPDGKVTFSDRPPPEATAKAAGSTAAAAAPASGGSGLGALPFELRTIASKYPVTLYTGANCNPCGAGRSYLQSRGIPFTERTITTPDDVQALTRLAGAASLPFLTIGGQQLRGYSDAEWGTFLDAAGYPKSSRLPSSFRNPAPTPLVAVQAPPPPQAGASAPVAATAEAPAASAAPAEPPPANPSGIRF